MKPIILTLIASLTLATTAPANMLTLHMTGYFGPATTLDGVALAANTPFDFRATFDPAAPANLFPVSTLEIAVGGTYYDALPGPNLYVHTFTFVGAYVVGLYDPVEHDGL